MKRVMVLGCSGAGKSTFARKLGALIGAPVIHMDALYWTPGWVGCEAEEFRRRTIVAHAGEAWVSDGNYSTITGEIRIPRADTIIWLEQPRWRCMARVLIRWAGNAGRARADLGPECPDKIDWDFLVFVWRFKARHETRQLHAIASHGGQGRLVTLNGDRAGAEYLAAIARGGAA